MSMQYGGNLVLKLGDGGDPEIFSSLGGLRVTRLRMAQQTLETDTLESGSWRTLQAVAGQRSLTLSGTGAFTDTEGEDALRAKALTGLAANWRLQFPNGDTLTGAFVVSTYERTGDITREEEFALTLESAGPLVYVTA